MTGLVAIVILNYCQSELTLECLRSLRLLNYKNIEVIVTDNSPVSNRLPESKVRDIVSDCKVIYNDSNKGVSAGSNSGFLRAIQDGAEFIWMLNNDTIVKEDSLIKLVEKMNLDSQIGAVSSAIYDIDGKKMQTIGCGRLNLYKFYTLANTSVEMPFDFLYGTSMLIRTKAMTEVGFWDEKIFMYFEDVEFCLRLKNKKWKLACAPDSVIYHHEGASLEGKKGLAGCYSLISAWYLASKYSTSPVYSYLMIIFTRIIKPFLLGNFKDVCIVLKHLFYLKFHLKEN